jgi:hypothetical protein
MTGGKVAYDNRPANTDIQTGNTDDACVSGVTRGKLFFWQLCHYCCECCCP